MASSCASNDAPSISWDPWRVLPNGQWHREGQDSLGDWYEEIQDEDPRRPHSAKDFNQRFVFDSWTMDPDPDPDQDSRASMGSGGNNQATTRQIVRGDTRNRSGRPGKSEQHESSYHDRDRRKGSRSSIGDFKSRGKSSGSPRPDAKREGSNIDIQTVTSLSSKQSRSGTRDTGYDSPAMDDLHGVPFGKRPADLDVEDVADVYQRLEAGESFASTYHSAVKGDDKHVPLSPLSHGKGRSRTNAVPEDVPYHEDWSRYVTEPSRKFTFGTVFKIMWSEPMGDSRLSRHNAGRVGTGTPISEFGQRNVNGTLLYEGVRRFVVIDGNENGARNGNSICVPIATYKKQSCTKNGVKPYHHGVIYTQDTPPVPMNDKPNLGYSTSQPTEISELKGIQKLAPESRINYSKHVTIEHIERIHPDRMGKRKYQSSEEGGHEEEQLSNQARKCKQEESHFPFACPYVKRYGPHAGCNSSNNNKNKNNKNKNNDNNNNNNNDGGWPNSARVKEHLYRYHRQPIHCIRCFTIFEDPDVLDSHILEQEPLQCVPSSNARVEGFSKKQEVMLRSRKGLSRLSECQKWRNIYVILFPDTPKDQIPSPAFNRNEYHEAPAGLNAILRQKLAQQLTYSTTKELKATHGEDYESKLNEEFFKKVMNEVLGIGASNAHTEYCNCKADVGAVQTSPAQPSDHMETDSSNAYTEYCNGEDHGGAVQTSPAQYGDHMGTPAIEPSYDMASDVYTSDFELSHNNALMDNLQDDFMRTMFPDSSSSHQQDTEVDEHISNSGYSSRKSQGSQEWIGEGFDQPISAPYASPSVSSLLTSTPAYSTVIMNNIPDIEGLTHPLWTHGQP